MLNTLEPEGATAAAISRLSKRLETLETLSLGGTAYPTRATLIHDESAVISGSSPITYVQNAATWYGFQTPAANGNEWAQTFVLKSGSYTLWVHYTLETSGGKLDIYLDDVLSVSGMDFYGAVADNVRVSHAVTITGSGRHVLRGVVNGKNGASGGFNIRIQRLWFVPPAEEIELD